MGEPLEGHYLYNTERRPADVVANHMQVSQLPNGLMGTVNIILVDKYYLYLSFNEWIWGLELSLNAGHLLRNQLRGIMLITSYP